MDGNPDELNELFRKRVKLTRERSAVVDRLHSIDEELRKVDAEIEAKRRKS